MNRAWVLLTANALLTSSFMLAQTTPATPPANKPPATKPAIPILKLPAGKPAAPQATAPKATPPASKTPAAATKTSAPLQPAVSKTSAAGTQTAVPLQPASTMQTIQSAQPSSLGSVPSQLGSAASQIPGVPANTYTGAANNYAGGSQGAAGNNYANGGAARSAPGASVGSFTWPGGWTLTSYGCFRADTRMFCDFDTSNPNNQQANTSIWSGAGGVNLVDDGGKITQRSAAFFVGTDGSTFQNAYISQQPVRFVIEYDNVNARYTSVSLVLTNNRIQAVPVRAMDPNQPAGTIPPR